MACFAPSQPFIHITWSPLVSGVKFASNPVKLDMAKPPLVAVSLPHIIHILQTLSSMEKPTVFLYARKSTDVEDKQVLSIEAQLAELRSYAKLEGLEIAEEFVEKKSAKMPGRLVFNDMMNRLERKEAVGIIAWHPDRLARNSVDGGRVVYLLDCEHISMLKFPTFWFENTSQGKFMLSIAFGQSKYYVDSLSENTKRR